MGNGLYFSLNNLPERYRSQVAAKLGMGTRPSSAGEPAKPTVPHKVKRSAPIRMRKSQSGMNQTEAQFNRDVLLGKGKYEALTLHLPGGVKYTPDFVMEDGGVIYLFEVKGSYHLPTHGRSVMAFKIACSEFPMFTFVFAELAKNGRTWKIGRFKDGKELGSVSGTASELHSMEE